MNQPSFDLWPTDRAETINGVFLQEWEAISEDGYHCRFFVQRIEIYADEDMGHFLAEAFRTLPLVPVMQLDEPIARPY